MFQKIILDFFSPSFKEKDFLKFQHFKEYNQSTFWSSMLITFSFGNVKFLRNYLFEMLKFF